MKKNIRFRRFIPLLLCITMVISFLPALVSALPATSMSIRFRIEGISQNFYDQTLVVPYTTPTLSVQTALAYLDTMAPDVAITGVASGFISDVNGDASGTFGGWDGWLFLLNSAAPSTGIDTTLLNDGDTVILYYGDPFEAVGFQYPDVDSSKISSGILKFTSKDTTFAADMTSTVTTNPIAGATVTWYYGGATAAYVTDANGEAVIPEGQRAAGDHRIQIEKYGTAAVSGKYLPLVLRLSQNALVTMSADSTSSTGSSSSSASSSSSGNSSLSNGSSSSVASGNPPAGDSSMALPVIAVVLSLAAIAIFMIRKNRKPENKDSLN